MWSKEAQSSFIYSLTVIEQQYLHMIKFGCKPDQARSILPNSLKTEIICTANLREWIHIFKERCSPAAHIDIRTLMNSTKELIKPYFNSELFK